MKKPTLKELEEEKLALAEMNEDVPLVRYKKRKANNAELEKEVEKADGHAATLVPIPTIGQPRKKLAMKKLIGVTQYLKEVEAVKDAEVRGLRRGKKRKQLISKGEIRQLKRPKLILTKLPGK